MSPSDKTPEKSSERSVFAWGERNQSRMGREFARLKALLRGTPPPEAEPGASAAIDEVVELFALTPFERDLLLLAAGVEMDGEFAQLLAPGGCASFGFALATLPFAHWSALSPQSPLRRWRLIEVQEGGTLVSARLRIDERILHFLAGLNELDQRLRPLLAERPLPTPLSESQGALAVSLAAELGQADSPWPLVLLEGADAAGKRDVAARLAAELGLRLHELASADIPELASEREALATLWEREAALLPAALLIEGGERADAALKLAERLSGLVVLAVAEPLATERGALSLAVDKPPSEERLALWQQLLGGDEALDRALPEVAAEFRLSAADIRRIAVRIANPAGTDPCARLRQSCRAASSQPLAGLARRIAPQAGWSELVLPEGQIAVLRQIVSPLRQQLTVCERWGFARRSARGLGISALFAGESGTGKTMAAEVLAGELSLDLYRIELATVVSKYIGETEKNLARIFAAAEDSGAILLFDEADALFGRRSEVRDSHDRYANIEVSYLLQCMETYCGLAILTSNRKEALDSAFQRRLRFVVSFPFPDQAGREAIWRTVFPAQTPTEGLDCAKLARLAVSGGGIRNIALNAAFRAAEEGRPVTMSHLLRAAHDEAAKRDQAIGQTETRGWV